MMIGNANVYSPGTVNTEIDSIANMKASHAFGADRNLTLTTESKSLSSTCNISFAECWTVTS